MATTNRKLVLGGAIALSLAALLFWIASKNGDSWWVSSKKSESQDALVMTSTNAIGTTPTSTRVTQPGKESSTPAAGAVAVQPAGVLDSSTTAAYKVFRTVNTAREALRAIDAMSTVSKSDKLYFRALLGELCSDPGLEKLRATGTQPAIPSAASNPTSSPERERARALFDQKRLRYYCEGMPVLSVEAQRAAWAEAASVGDLRSKVRLDWVAFEGTFKPDPSVPAGGALAPEKTLSPPTWDKDTLNSLIQGLSTRDPAAVINIGNMLQQTSHTNFIALSATGTSLADVPIATWNLVACQYGAVCGPESTTLLAACANEGRCDVASMEDYYRRYVWTAEEAARYDALSPYLRDLVDRGDRSLLTILPFDPSKAPQHRHYGQPPRSFKPG